MAELAQAAGAGNVMHVQIGASAQRIDRLLQYLLRPWRALSGIRTSAVLRRGLRALHASQTEASRTAARIRRAAHPHRMEPPFTLITSPVMKVARSEAANRIGPAISSRLATRLSGYRRVADFNPSLGFQHRSRHIRIHPSRRHAIDQNLCRASSSARPLTKLMMAPFVAA